MSRRTRFPWKHNLIKIPPAILHKIQGFRSDTFIVGTTIKIPESRIKDGLYNHVGITWQNGLHFEAQVLPNPSVGSWSKTNVEGKLVKLTHLPKVEQTRSMTVPNYGEWWRGSHEINITQEVYQTRLIVPKQITLKLQLIGQEPGADPNYVFHISVEEILNRTSSTINEGLLYDLNLLQENFGVVDVFPSSASVDDYLRTLYVNWEILPPGEREGNIAVILRGIRGISEQQKRNIRDRYTFLEGLRPQDFVVGSSGFSRYFGARFSENLVVFENVQYGNAIYVMGSNWSELSRQSRTELMKTAINDFTRIPHIGEWKDRLREEIYRRRRQTR